jgi:hypothetical protein
MWSLQNRFECWECLTRSAKTGRNYVPAGWRAEKKTAGVNLIKSEWAKNGPSPFGCWWLWLFCFKGTNCLHFQGSALGSCVIIHNNLSNICDEVLKGLQLRYTDETFSPPSNFCTHFLRDAITHKTATCSCFVFVDKCLLKNILCLRYTCHLNQLACFGRLNDWKIWTVLVRQKQSSIQKFPISLHGLHKLKRLRNNSCAWHLTGIRNTLQIITSTEVLLPWNKRKNQIPADMFANYHLN